MSIALKASKIPQSSSDESDSDEQDDVAMITRQVRKFLKKKKTSQGNFKEAKRNHIHKCESSKERDIICYECKEPDHMRGECPKLLRKIKKERHNKRKAMVATWSDEDSDTSSSSEDQKENLCLMTIEDNSREVNF